MLDRFRRNGYVFIKDGPHAFLANFMISFHAVTEKSDMEAYVARLGEVARALDQTVEMSKLSAAAGVRPPRFAYDQVISGIAEHHHGRAVWRGRGLAAVGRREGQDQVAGRWRQADCRRRRRRWKLRLPPALIEKVKPAYERVIAWLRGRPGQYRASRRRASRRCRMAKRYYNAMLEAQTTTQMTAGEIHDLGLKEVARIRVRTWKRSA